MSDTPEESVVKPLTRVNKKTGKPYVRPKPIETEIEAALDLPLHDAFSLASKGSLRPQTLVYLIRNFKPNRSTPAYDAMVVAFFSRLQRVGDGMLSDLPENYRERAWAYVQDKVLAWFGDDRMDIFEMSFKLGAERLFLTARAMMRRRMATEIPGEDLRDPDIELTAEETADALGLVHRGIGASLAQARIELADALARMTDRERLAVKYVHLLGRTEKEAGELMGCSDRNVRYLLANARSKALKTKS